VWALNILKLPKLPILLKFDAFSRATFGRFLADVFKLGWNFVDDYFSDIAVHFEYFGAKIDTDLISSAEIFVYCDLHNYLLSLFYPRSLIFEGLRAAKTILPRDFQFLAPNI
jgi:hypothetical protein